MEEEFKVSMTERGGGGDAKGIVVQKLTYLYFPDYSCVSSTYYIQT
jgi:hypothetical protein